MPVHVTEHAVDRYIERVAAVGRQQARTTIQSAERAIAAAVAIGAHTVRLGNGAKLVLRGSAPVRVVTVLERGQISAADFPHTAPVCCGLCGLHCGHPIAGACTRPECPLGAQRRTANDQQGGKS
jgi:hypothetical protein